MRKWMRAASVARPITPPRASTSRATTPFAIPPIAGLQLICPTRPRSGVTSSVLHPSRAAAVAASTPAWPAPTTTTSQLRFNAAPVRSALDDESLLGDRERRVFDPRHLVHPC